MQPALLDRMEQINIPGYTSKERLLIADKFIVPNQIEQHGLDSNIISFTQPALIEVIDNYTREAGVRDLQRSLGSICRNVALTYSIFKQKERPKDKVYKFEKVIIDVPSVGKILGFLFFFVNFL